MHNVYIYPLVSFITFNNVLILFLTILAPHRLRIAAVYYERYFCTSLLMYANKMFSKTDHFDFDIGRWDPDILVHTLATPLTSNKTNWLYFHKYLVLSISRNITLVFTSRSNIVKQNKYHSKNTNVGNKKNIIVLIHF